MSKLSFAGLRVLARTQDVGRHRAYSADSADSDEFSASGRLDVSTRTRSLLWWTAVHRGQSDDLLETLAWCVDVTEIILPPDGYESLTPIEVLADYINCHGGTVDPVVMSIAERIGDVQEGQSLWLPPEPRARLSLLSRRMGLSVERATEWAASIGLVVLCDPSTYDARTPRNAVSAFLLRAYARKR